MSVAAAIGEPLAAKRKGLLARASARLSLPAGTIRNPIGDSWKLAVAVSRDWFASSTRVSFFTFYRRTERCQTVPSDAADLWALQQEFDDVEFNGEESALWVATEAINGDVYLGRFRCAYLDSRVNCIRMPYYVTAIDPHPPQRQRYNARHVSHDVVCEGDAQRPRLEQGDW